MIVVRHPTAEELVELKRMTRREIGWVAQRAQMILLSAQERIVPEMAQIFDVHPKSVRHWIGRFNQAGPAGLYDAPRSGRPRRATPGVRDALVDMIQQDPAGSGYLATFWTVAMLVLALANRLTVRISASTVRATLRAVGLRWGRPRLAMPNKTDPHKAAKQWAIAQAVIDAGPTATVLYADEARIALLPLLRAMWHWVGQQVRIPTPGSNVSRAVFGALNIRTGEWTYLVREHMDKENFIAFLEHLLLVYATGTIILIVDNYSSHTAGAVATWLAAQTRLKLFYLPKYCSHLNPVENIWLHLKGRMAANRLYGSMKLLLDFVDSFFTAMTPELALTWADA